MLNCSISGKGETIRTTNSVMSLTRQGSHGSHPLSPTVPQFDARSEEEALRSEEEALRSGEEALRSEEEALRSEEEALRSEEEALSSEEEALRSEEEALRSGKEGLRRDRRMTLQGIRINDKQIV